MNHRTFIRKGSLYLPKKDPDTIFVFVDETYFADNSAFVQAAIALPKQPLEGVLVPRCKELLKKLGKDAKEFKASKISKGNKAVYLELMRLAANVFAKVGEQSPLRPIISVDATAIYGGENYDYVLGKVLEAFGNAGVHGEEPLAGEFARQVLWLHAHYPKMIPEYYTNPMSVCFDNKYGYSKRCQSVKGIRSLKGDECLFANMGEVLAALANIAFRELKPIRRVLNIQDFRFLWSEESFGIQVCDLLAHLIYHAIRYELGLHNDNTALKHEMFKEIVPHFRLDSFPPNCLRLENGEVVCAKPDLHVTMKLQPNFT